MQTFIFDGADRVIAASPTRTFRGMLRRAIQVRDRHCQHPSGCDEPITHCDVNHRMPVRRRWHHRRSRRRPRMRITQPEVRPPRPTARLPDRRSPLAPGDGSTHPPTHRRPRHPTPPTRSTTTTVGGVSAVVACDSLLPSTPSKGETCRDRTPPRARGDTVAAAGLVIAGGMTLPTSAPTVGAVPPPPGATVVGLVAGPECPTPIAPPIQAVIDAAAPGATIFICAGTYTEQLTINKPLTLLGAQSGVDARTGRTDPAAETVFNVPAGAIVYDGRGDHWHPRWVHADRRHRHRGVRDRERHCGRVHVPEQHRHRQRRRVQLPHGGRRLDRNRRQHRSQPVGRKQHLRDERLRRRDDRAGQPVPGKHGTERGQRQHPGCCDTEFGGS